MQGRDATGRAVSLRLPLTLRVQPAAASSYSDLFNLSRVAWLDSRAGLAPGPPRSNPHMQPLRLSCAPQGETGAAAGSNAAGSNAAGGAASSACTDARGNALPPAVLFGGGRRLALSPDGLPRQISVNGANLLAAPMSVLLRGGSPLPSHQLHAPPRLSLADAGHAAWRAEALAADGSGLHYECAARAEYDGWADFTVRLSARGGKPVSLEGVTLLMPLRKAMATYALGLRFRGGRRPPRLQWEWRQLVEGTRKFQRGDHALWLGEVDAGVQLNLKGEEPEWEVPFG